jgi:hypothetical protein
MRGLLVVNSYSILSAHRIAGCGDGLERSPDGGGGQQQQYAAANCERGYDRGLKSRLRDQRSVIIAIVSPIPVPRKTGKQLGVTSPNECRLRTEVLMCVMHADISSILKKQKT